MVTLQEWADWVNKQLAGHQAHLKTLGEDLGKLANKVRPLYEEHLEPKVLELLRSEEKPRTWRWICNRLGYDAWASLQNLIAKGLVTTGRSGYKVMYVATKEGGAE